MSKSSIYNHRSSRRSRRFSKGKSSIEDDILHTRSVTIDCANLCSTKNKEREPEQLSKSGTLTRKIAKRLSFMSPRRRVTPIDFSPPNVQEIGCELLSPRISPGRDKAVSVKFTKSIGKGGSGSTVYAATIDGWKCCVKEIPINLGILTKDFEAEIDILRTLPSNNANLIRYLGFQRDVSHIRIFMTLYDGSVRDLIKHHSKQNKRLSLKHILRCANHILQGLCVLHSRRLLHRDIKSGNVLIEGSLYDIDSLKFVLGDFGEAKIMKQDFTKTVRGTCSWMAPEVINAHEPDNDGYTFSADVWSFGMLLYELMTLKIPYHDKKGFHVHTSILNGELPKIDKFASKEYVSIIPIWEEILAYEPSQRPVSAKLLFLLQ